MGLRRSKGMRTFALENIQLLLLLPNHILSYTSNEEKLLRF